MNNFVISLKNAELRREHISKEFSEKNINFNFFDAINTSQIEETARFLNINFGTADLTDGEKACLLSHVYLWSKTVNDQLDYISIFEDDIHLGKNCDQFLNDYSWIDNDIDIIKLETFSQSALMSFNKISLADGRVLRKLKGIHLGAAGYTISQKSAQILLDYIRGVKMITPVDHILFEYFVNHSDLNIYQLCPGVCIQSDRFNSNTRVITSQLEFERRERLDINRLKHNKIKRSISFKIQREYKRFILNICLLFCKITFK